MADFVGGPIEDFIREQFKRRGDIYGKRIGRTAEDFRFLASRTGWVRVTSAVNVRSNPNEQAPNSELSKSLILQGGAVRLQGDKIKGYSGIRFDKNDSSDRTAVYNPTDSFGVRPMPGITSFDLKYKNAFGTIREANVDFEVWSTEDLDKVEKLFFRPGYSVIIEWGHSTYVNNSGEVVNARLTPGYNKFFDTISRTAAQQIVNAEKKASDGNYEGMIGFVKNFRWSLRQDGGYSCSISVISEGELLESLKADRPVIQFIGENETILIPQEAEQSKRKEVTDVEFSRTGTAILTTKEVPNPTFNTESVMSRKSAFHYLYAACLNLSEKSKEQDQFLTFQELKGIGSTFFSKLEETKVSDNLVALTPPIIVDESEAAEPFFYVSLRTILAIFNSFYILVGDNEPLVSFNLNGKDKLKSPAGHFSADPKICVLPKVPNAGGVILDFSNKEKLQHANLKSLTGDSTDKVLKVLDILVNVKHVVEIMDRFYNSASGNLDGDIQKIITTLLDSLENPLGGINELDLAFDPDERTFNIVDRSVTPETSTLNDPIILTGLDSSNIEVSIETKISSRLGSFIAISAQASSPNNNNTKISGPMSIYNRGKIDRFNAVRSVPLDFQPQLLTSRGSFVDIPSESFQPQLLTSRGSFVDIPSESTAKDTRREKFVQLVTNITNTFLSTTPTYKSEDFSTLVQESIFYANADKEKIGELNAQGIIPAEVTLKTDGIGGLKIGQAFKPSNGILLEVYKDYGLIITGLDSAIENGRWVTSIRGLTFPPYTAGTKPTSAIPSPQSSPSVPVEEPDLLPTPAETPPATPEADRLRAVLSQLGYYEKGDELSSGGDITKETADMGIAVARKLKELIPGLKVTFTGGNDIYHQRRSSNSRHKEGRGLDFIIFPTIAKNQVVDILQGFAAGNTPNFRYLNEYDNPTIFASGKHFHISWGPGTEAQSNLTLAQARAQRGEINTFSIT